ncbi:MAG TPA: hypothetical protein VE523_01785, partial [Solirubrobacterales bacterium]|nr:hypothetical protein [Solirubrobacterales bacterium]
AAGTAPASATLGRPRHRLALVARIAVAVALLPLLTAGLAVAGVRLPDAAADAFDSVGVDLPNQAASEDSNGTGGSAGDEDRAGARVPGDEDRAGDSGEATSEPGAAGRANADEKRGVDNGEGQGKVPSHAGDGGPPSHSNAGGSGGDAGNGPPASSNSGGDKAGSSGGQGSAVEGVGAKPAAPPGQAHRPADPGNSGSVRGQLEVEDG